MNRKRSQWVRLERGRDGRGAQTGAAVEEACLNFANVALTMEASVRLQYRPESCARRKAADWRQSYISIPSLVVNKSSSTNRVHKWKVTCSILIAAASMPLFIYPQSSHAVSHEMFSFSGPAHEVGFLFCMRGQLHLCGERALLRKRSAPRQMHAIRPSRRRGSQCMQYCSTVQINAFIH
jgi:hypothetical protein